MVIFFLLGLLVTPSQLPEVFVPALLLCLFMLFIGRPVSVLAILKPFGASWQQIGVVSWAGLRGVASIVFSIYVVLSGIPMTYNLFNMVFVIVLLSLAVQGTLLPAVSRKLEMIDKNANVMRTFNDYQDENDISFVKIKITDNHPFAGKTLKEIEMPPGVLVVLLFRGQETMMPNGDTSLEGGDLLICAAPAFEDRENLTLYEVEIDKNHKWRDKPVNELTRKQGCSLSWSKEKEALSFPMEIRLSDRMICWCFVGKNTQNRRMGKFHVLFCFWMCEFQTAGKELQLGKRSLVRIIFSVSCDGTAKVSHLYPDLVMTSGIQMNLCQ